MNSKRSLRRLSTLVVLVVVATAACTATPTSSTETKVPSEPTSPGTNDAGPVQQPLVVAPGQLAIQINQVRQRRGAAADALEIAVTLANGVGGQAVMLNPAYFKLKVKSGLLKMANLGAKAQWVNGTSPALTDALSGGASFGPWSLAFDVDANADAPVELSFEVPSLTTGSTTLGDARKAVANVVLEACTPCGAVCTYLDRDQANCGTCGVKAEGTCSGGTISCTTGAATTLCKSTSEMYCADLKTSERSCGACGVSLPRGGSCNNGVPKCVTVGYSPCSGVCVDLQGDEDNCGVCGAKTGELGFCDRGVIECNKIRFASLCSGQCVALDERENCGACGNVCPTGKSCRDRNGTGSWNCN